MKLLRIFITCLIVSLLSACGVGEFFVKRAVNGLKNDVASEFKKFASFDQEQEQQIDLIAQHVDQWMRSDRLPILYGELEKIADNIEQDSRISESTWASTVAFLERPMNLAEQTNVVPLVAQVVYSLSDEQAQQAIKKMGKDYRKTLKEQAKVTLHGQNKKLIKGFKIVFLELGISRNKDQLKTAKAMLENRKSHIDLENQMAERDQAAFQNLVENRQIEQAQYVSQFIHAWRNAELGAKHQAPALWNHNAKVALDVLNFLLSDLTTDQRTTAAKRVRNYADLFRKLAVVDT